MRSEVVRRGAERLRIGPWRGDRRVAFLSPLTDSIPPTAAMVEHACEVLARRGYTRVLTGALADRERRGFEAAGFAPHEELHLLAHDLTTIPEVAPRPIRRGWWFDRRRALAVDGAAFPPFWRLDRHGLREAVNATPIARFRVATTGGHVVGYAVTGRAGRRGYVQRLAVEPAHSGQGIGAALVVDGLRWLAGAGVEQAVVNTQSSNQRALRLYEQLGFRRQPTGLLVLERGLA